MLFSTVLTWLLIAAAFVIALPSLWLGAQALWPESAQRRRVAAERGLVGAFFLGLAPVLVGVVLVAVLSKLPKMGPLAALVGGLLLTWGFVGASGMATLVGERLWAAAAPWRQTLRGGLILMGCALLPVVGWVVLLPLLGVLGCGLHLRARFVKARPISAVEAPLAANL